MEGETINFSQEGWGREGVYDRSWYVFVEKTRGLLGKVRDSVMKVRVLERIADMLEGVEEWEWEPCITLMVWEGKVIGDAIGHAVRRGVLKGVELECVGNGVWTVSVEKVGKALDIPTEVVYSLFYPETPTEALSPAMSVAERVRTYISQ